MRKSSKTDSELLTLLSRNYRPEYEAQQSDMRIIETRGSVCYNVDLRGELGTVCAGISTVAPNYLFKLSDYPFHRMVFTVSGQVEVEVDNKTQLVEAGELYYFPPEKVGTVISRTSNVWKLIYVHFTGTKVEQILNKAAREQQGVWTCSNPGMIQNLFENIALASLEQSEDSQVICDSYLRILLTRLNSMVLDNHTHCNASRLKYLDCYNYINHNFSEIGTIEDISKNCHISGIYLCRLFKKYAQATPMAYVTKLKMNKAAMLLMKTDASIKQISHTLAFDDPYYFSKAFKRIYGISPKKYRDSR